MMVADIKHILKHPTILIYVATNELEIRMTDSVKNSLIDIQDSFESMNITSNCEINTHEKCNDSCESSDVCSATKDAASVVDCLKLNSSSSQPSSDSSVCLNESEKLLKNFEFHVSNVKGSYFKKTVQELNKYSLKQLQVLIENLTHSVEEVSGELVQLLLENDALQQESDARNIAIEQLLKMTVKVNESDLKTIQMSVILPDDDCDVV